VIDLDALANLIGDEDEALEAIAYATGYRTGRLGGYDSGYDDGHSDGFGAGEASVA
jgi:hypothetical protein